MHTVGSNRNCHVWQVPTGVAVFPKEIAKVPKNWVCSMYNLQHWTVFDRGGHFAAKEVPELLAKDVQDFFGNTKVFGQVAF